MQVASCIDGRLRIRDQKLTQNGVAEAVCAVLSALPGINQVTVNERVGSVLIIYAAAVTKLQSIMESIAGLLGEQQEEPSRSCSSVKDSFVAGIRSLRLPDKKTTVNLGMLAALITSMLGIMFGLKKLHVAAGILFLAFFGIHLFERRRAMFA
jgi:hypothetical protein